MSSLNTSRKRYLDFLRKFRTNKLGIDHDESSQNRTEDRQEAKGTAQPSADPSAGSLDRDSLHQTADFRKAEKKLKRRKYLRLYLRELWPHWPAVALLVLLSLLIAGLELAQPLFFRYIIDQILLNDSREMSQRLIQLNWVGGMALMVVIVSQSLGIFKNYRQHMLNVRVILKLRRALFDRMLRLPLESLSRTSCHYQNEDVRPSEGAGSMEQLGFYHGGD